MRQAALYARVSTGRQEKERTIESQVDELKRQVKGNGDVLVREYIDDGYSGRYLDRPGLEKLMQEMKTDSFDVVYFHSPDRIARKSVNQDVIISELIKSKKRIVIGGKDYEENPENKFALTVFGAVAELERAKILERMRRGWLHRLRSGHITSHGMNIFGYTYVPKTETTPPKLVIKEDEAKIVRFIFEKYSNDELGTCRISRTLEEMGIASSTGRTQWKADVVRRMLRNTTYMGIRYFNRITREEVYGSGKPRKTPKLTYRDPSEWIAVKVPAIVSKSTFDKAQARLKKSRERYRRPNKIHLLRGLIKCGECGKSYTSARWYEKRVRKSGEIKVDHYAAYKCSSRTTITQHDLTKLKRCFNGQTATHLLDEAVLKTIETTLLNPKRLALCIASEENVVDANTSKKLSQLTRKMNLAEEQRRKLVEGYMKKDILPERYVARNKALDSQIANLKLKKEELAHVMNMRGGLPDKSIEIFCASAKARFEECTNFETKYEFLHDYIEKIVFTSGRFTIISTVTLGDSSTEGVIPLSD